MIICYLGPIRFCLAQMLLSLFLLYGSQWSKIRRKARDDHPDWQCFAVGHLWTWFQTLCLPPFTPIGRICRFQQYFHFSHADMGNACHIPIVIVRVLLVARGEGVIDKDGWWMHGATKRHLLIISWGGNTASRRGEVDRLGISTIMNTLQWSPS